MSFLDTSDNLESDIADVPVIDGPEVVNDQMPLSQIDSLFERAFEDSKRDDERIYIYTDAPTKEASVFTGTVVAYDETFVVLVEGDGKMFGTKEQQQIVRRDRIVGLRSAYNMLAHTS